MSNAFIAGSKQGFQAGGRALRKIGVFSIAPLLFSAALINNTTRSGGDYDFSEFYAFLGFLTLPATLFATLFTFTTALIAGLAVALGTPLYAGYRGIKASVDASRAKKTSHDAIQTPLVLSRMAHGNAGGGYPHHHYTGAPMSHTARFASAEPPSPSLLPAGPKAGA
jgi:hypothetical protein